MLPYEVSLARGTGPGTYKSPAELCCPDPQLYSVSCYGRFTWKTSTKSHLWLVWMMWAAPQQPEDNQLVYTASSLCHVTVHCAESPLCRPTGCYQLGRLLAQCAQQVHADRIRTPSCPLQLSTHTQEQIFLGLNLHSVNSQQNLHQDITHCHWKLEESLWIDQQIRWKPTWPPSLFFSSPPCSSLSSPGLACPRQVVNFLWTLL